MKEEEVSCFKTSLIRNEGNLKRMHEYYRVIFPNNIIPAGRPP